MNAKDRLQKYFESRDEDCSPAAYVRRDEVLELMEAAEVEALREAITRIGNLSLQEKDEELLMYDTALCDCVVTIEELIEESTDEKHP